MKVLIVDDEPPARDRLRQLLEDMNAHEVVGEAGNGREALDVAARAHPDVVLLDIRMPGMDGIETAHHLNQADPPPAVVFTTAYDEYAIDAFEANAIGYVLKPVRRERLSRDAVAALLADVPGQRVDRLGRIFVHFHAERTHPAGRRALSSASAGAKSRQHCHPRRTRIL